MPDKLPRIGCVSGECSSNTYRIIVTDIGGELRAKFHNVENTGKTSKEVAKDLAKISKRVKKSFFK